MLLGEDAAGLSPTNIARLTGAWDAEHQTFWRRDLSESDFVYVWVDRIHFNIRLEDDRLCRLVVLGVRADGTKELVVAREDDYRESAESWASVLRGPAPACSASGLRCATSGRRRPRNATGATRWPTCSTSFPNAFGRGPSGNGAHLLRWCTPACRSSMACWMSAARRSRRSGRRLPNHARLPIHNI